MEKQTTGEFLALLRKANGYTQQDVAEKLGVSNRTLSSWETDRTMPDVLILPSIADLYGVTVDELLRGERFDVAQKNAEISKKARRLARKNRYGKFKARCTILTVTGALSSFLVVLLFILEIFSASPLWLNILIGVTGGCGLIVCLALVFYFAYSLQAQEGIILDEDYDESNRGFSLAVKRNAANFLLFGSLPFLAGSILFAVMMLAVAPFDYYAISLGVCGAFTLVLTVAYLVYINVCIKKYGNGVQVKNNKHNAVLAGKLCGFGVIPIVALVIIFIILVTTISYRTEIYSKTENLSDFKDDLQTLEVREGDLLNTRYGYAAGKYVLTFPNEFKIYQTYNLGHGFYGYYSFSITHYPDDSEVNHRNLIIYVLCEPMPDDATEPLNYCEYLMASHIFTSYEGQTIVNLRYPYADYSVKHYGLGIVAYENYELLRADGYYIYEKSIYTEFDGLATWLFPTVISGSAAVFTTIYFVKRKKQYYSF